MSQVAYVDVVELAMYCRACVFSVCSVIALQWTRCMWLLFQGAGKAYRVRFVHRDDAIFLMHTVYNVHNPMLNLSMALRPTAYDQGHCLMILFRASLYGQ